MDDSGSGLATAMVAFLVANPALDDCFFAGVEVVRWTTAVLDLLRQWSHF